MDIPIDARPIKQYDKYFVDQTGNVYSARKKKVVRLIPFYIGQLQSQYLAVQIRRDDKRYMNRKIHHLVAKAFIPNPNNFPFILHRNDIRSDNRVENLYWGDGHDNQSDSRKNGRLAFGENIGTSKLHSLDVMNIRHLHCCGLPYRSISTIYNISSSTASRICSGVSWKHVSYKIGKEPK